MFQMVATAVRFRSFGSPLRPFAGPLGRCGRTHPRASLKRVRRTIHRLQSANWGKPNPYAFGASTHPL